MELGFDVVDLAESDHPTEGSHAPDFRRPLVTDEYWEDVSLSDLTAEEPVLLVCHPMDGAFPAMYIWNEVFDRAWEHEYDITIVGLSISTPYEHMAFIEDRQLPYRLFSDPQNEVAESYGIVNDLDGMAGVSEPRPAVFLLEGDRTVRYAWVAHEWPAFPDYDEIDEVLGTL